MEFGDIVKVKFDNKRPPHGLILSRKAPLVQPVACDWLNRWKVPGKWFKFSLHKKLQSAHGIFVAYEHSLEYFLVYFPRLLKSGASCVLDIEEGCLDNHIDIEEAHKLHKYVLELSKIQVGVDNFQIIETLARHKHGHV